MGDGNSKRARRRQFGKFRKYYQRHYNSPWAISLAKQILEEEDKRIFQAILDATVLPELEDV